MNHIITDEDGSARSRHQLQASIGEALREVLISLSTLNRQVGSRLALKDVDLDCLNAVDRDGPISPSVLAKSLGLHPATLTGVLDRLEQGGWVARERDPLDRRAVLVLSLRDRRAEVMRLYSGMNKSVRGICASYSDSELERIDEFLRSTAAAGRSASDELVKE
jgi:DNA-binding MarR family transcriptional regulator